jgi:Family of unknown function (DUF6491)
MIVRRTLSLLMVLCLVTACASTAPRSTPAERLEFYRANAGEPVRSFHHPGRLWGWRAVGDSAMTVWPSGNRGYLLEFFGRCPELSFATSIALTNRTGRVSAGFDSVVFDARTGRGMRTTCRIDTIRPLNTRITRESEGELSAVEYVERDPSVPEEPQ